MTHTTDNLFRGRADKFLAAFTAISALLTIWGFFGLTGFAVIGTVIALIAIICGLCWLNEKTGGWIGFALILIGLS